jgi:membrane fusion protein (multidrug efflux system)
MANTEETQVTEAPKKKFNFTPYILGVIGIVLIVFITKKVIYAIHNEDTDNSQIQCNIVPIVPKVGGFIEEIRIDDNVYVHKGDTLVRIDDRDLKLQVKKAEVALANAQANVNVTQASQNTTNANVAVANKDISPARAL